MPNPITRSEAQFRLRNITAKLTIAQSAAKEGDWRIAFDNAYEAQDLLNILIPHLEEAVDELGNKRDTAPVPEPPGSLKYGVPPGTPEKRERVGGMGYRGSSHTRPPEPITVEATFTPTTPRAKTNHVPPDLRPPKPIIITPPPPIAKAPIITPPPITTPQPSPPKPPAPPKPAEKPLPVIPEGAEVVTLDINKLINGVTTEAERTHLTLLFQLPEEFRKDLLKHQALSRRPVTIYRVAQVWSIFK